MSSFMHSGPSSPTSLTPLRPNYYNPPTLLASSRTAPSYSANQHYQRDVFRTYRPLAPAPDPSSPYSPSAYDPSTPTTPSVSSAFSSVPSSPTSISTYGSNFYDPDPSRRSDTNTDDRIAEIMSISNLLGSAGGQPRR
jgi:hypothetical protein